MPSWKQIIPGVEVMVSPVNSDPISATDTSVNLAVDIFYRFTPSANAGKLINFSYDGAFVGNGTLTIPDVLIGESIVQRVAVLRTTVPINPAGGLSYNIILRNVAGAVEMQFTENLTIDPAPEYTYPTIKNVKLTRNGDIYTVNWFNEFPNPGGGSSRGTYYEILVEEMTFTQGTPVGPYEVVTKIIGTSTQYALVFTPNIDVRYLRFTPRDLATRNRGKSVVVMVRRIPSTPSNVVTTLIRNGIKLTWEVEEEGTRYTRIDIHSGTETQTINLNLADRSYSFMSLIPGTEYTFTVSHRDDVTRLFSEPSAKSNPTKSLIGIARGKRGIDYRLGNKQPRRVYLGDKLIWVR